MDELVAVGAHTVVLAHHVVGGIVVVVVVDACAPLLLRVAVVEDGEERAAHHLLRLLHSGKLKECWGVVDVLHQLVAHASRLGVARIADDERRAERLLVHESLVEPSVLAHVESLVGGVDDDGVVGESVGVEIVDDAAHALVDAGYYRHVVAYVGLVLPVVEVLALEVGLKQLAVAREVVAAPCRALLGGHAVDLAHEGVVGVLAVLVVEVEHLGHLEVLLPAHVLGDAHLLGAHGRAACGVVVVEGLGHRELHVVVLAEVLDVGLPVAVGRLVVEHKAERLRLVAVVHELDGVVGGEVGAVALLHDVLAAGSVSAAILRVPVLSLVVVDVVVVEALGVATHVPLADDGSLVASLLQQLGEEGARCVDALAELSLSVLVAVESCHKTCARRCGKRVLHESLVETHSALCDAVDVGCRCKLAYGVAVGRDALEGMVVAHDVNNVWTLCCGFLLGLHRGREAREGRKGNNRFVHQNR